jgi:hypothetical protein
MSFGQALCLENDKHQRPIGGTAAHCHVETPTIESFARYTHVVRERRQVIERCPKHAQAVPKASSTQPFR